MASAKASELQGDRLITCKAVEGQQEQTAAMHMMSMDVNENMATKIAAGNVYLHSFSSTKTLACRKESFHGTSQALTFHAHKV